MKYSLVNNKIIAKDDAVISSDDRAFRFGDSTFQSIKIHNGILYDIDSYLTRLFEAADILGFDYDFDINELKKNLKELVDKNNIDNGTLRINLSRGVGSMGYLPAKNIEAILVANCYDTTLNKINKDTIGVSEHMLWDVPMEFAKVKNIRSINYILTKIDANKKGFYDDVILTKEGYVSECSSSNIFWLKDKVIYTPDHDLGIYPGNIREKILANFDVKLAKANIDELVNSDEIFLTNSNILVKNISKIIFNDKEYKKNSALTEEISSFINNDLEEYCKRNG